MEDSVSKGSVVMSWLGSETALMKSYCLQCGGNLTLLAHLLPNFPFSKFLFVSYKEVCKNPKHELLCCVVNFGCLLLS